MFKKILFILNFMSIFKSIRNVGMNVLISSSLIFLLMSCDKQIPDPKDPENLLLAGQNE